MSSRSIEKYIGVGLAAVVLGGTFASGVFLGYENRPAVDKITSLVNKEDQKPDQVDFKTFWEAWNLLNQKYISSNGNSTSTKVVTEKERVWGALAGLTKSLDDPYTVFFPPEETKIFESDIAGNFQGVGMEVGVRDGIVTVIAPLKGTPAERAGMKSGDKILKIDGDTTADMSVDQAVRRIRGTKGTTVTLTVAREGVAEVFEVKIVRDVITIPTIQIEVRPQPKAPAKPGSGSTPGSSATTTEPKTQLVGVDDPLPPSELQDGVFVIHLYNFGAQSNVEFAKAMERFYKSTSNKLLIDLRGNPGGYLEAAVDIASWFIPAGQPVVIEKGANREDVTYTSHGYVLPKDNLKVAILVDRGSASASEILAGALSEYGKATLIGEKTYGKGSVQELVHLSDDSSLKITIARWYTPKGRSISLNGLDPDISISISKEDAKMGRDTVTAKAIEVLNK